MLKLALPSGSLQKPTQEIFAAADLNISTPDAAVMSLIDDHRISMVRWMRPQEIPLYVAEGRFDLGIGGYDWVVERGCADNVEVVMKLNYSKRSNHPVRLVVVVSETSPIQSVADIKPGSRVTTEYVEITRQHFEKLGIPETISDLAPPKLCLEILIELNC